MDCATESLTGSWKINEIRLYNQNEDVIEDNTEGFFHFQDDGRANFSFYRNNVLQEMSATWTLVETKINCGFTNCKKYTLNIGTEEFICEFGDKTSDAQCNATEIRLLQNGPHLSPYEDMILFLDKN